MKIFLIGYRCTGKTTIGKILANIMNYSFLDIDEKIQSDLNLPVSKIVKKSGWDKFRDFEKQTLFNTIHNKDLIISTGGGIILDVKNRDFMKNNGIVIWLFADYHTILQRFNNDNNSKELRPSLTDKKIDREIKFLMGQRKSLYSKIAQIKFDTSNTSPEEIGQLIKRRILNDR